MIEIKGFGNAVRIKRGEPFEKSDFLDIKGAKGERISFQLYFTTDMAGPAELRLSPGMDEKGITVETENRMYFEIFVPIRETTCSPFTPGEYADGIIEMSRAKELGLLNLEKGKEYAALVMLKIPETCAGKLVLSAVLEQNGEKAVLPVTVSPYAFALTEENRSKTAFLIWEDQNMILGSPQQQKQKYAELYEMLLDFRVSGGKIPRQDDSVEAFIRSAKKYAQDPRVSAYSVCYKSKRVDTDFGTNKEVLDLDYCRTLLSAMAENSTNENNLFKKAYFYITFIDEPMPDRFPAVRRCYQEVHDLKREIAKSFDFTGRREVEAALLTMDNIVTTFQKEPIYGEVDAWCPTFWGYSYAEYRYEEKQLRRLGKKNWWYGCMSPVHPWPNLHTDAPLADGRFESWMRYENDIAGNLYWCVNYHFKLDEKKGAPVKDLLDDAKCCASAIGDGMLIYTETRYGKPFPTLRLNSLCESAKDYEYLLIFDSLVKEAAFYYETDLKPRELLADLFRSMFDHAIITSGYRALEYAKDELAQRIEAAQNGVICGIEKFKNGKAYFAVYATKETEISSDCGTVILKEPAGGGMRTVFEVNPENNRITIKYKIGGKSSSLTVLTAKTAEISINDLRATSGKLNITERSDGGRLIRTAPFVNTEPPAFTVPYKADFSDINYLACDIESLCDNECILHISLVDCFEKRYNAGYEVVKENSAGTLNCCINKYTEKRLNVLPGPIEKTWEHDKKQAGILADFCFNDITALEFTLLNNVKLLDDNRERRVSEYDIIIKGLRTLSIK